jgi:hypothetical protein
MDAETIFLEHIWSTHTVLMVISAINVTHPKKGMKNEEQNPKANQTYAC